MGIVTKVMGRLRFFGPDGFLSDHYQHHNHRRLEHLASLGLQITGSTVLEVGAGIGDLTRFLLDHGCRVVSTDARERNLRVLRARYPGIRARRLDLDDPDLSFDEVFDICFCYGTLYHLRNPSQAIAWMSRVCRSTLLLETCVSFGDAEAVNLCREQSRNPTQSVSGRGCRPTRNYVYGELKRHFEFVYLPVTQPNHEEFPIDWSCPPPAGTLSRAVFVASRRELRNGLLTEEIPVRQSRH